MVVGSHQIKLQEMVIPETNPQETILPVILEDLQLMTLKVKTIHNRILNTDNKPHNSILLMRGANMEMVRSRVSPRLTYLGPPRISMTTLPPSTPQDSN